jgi:hypothetical protein
VLNTSAVVAFWLGFESGSRRDQAGTLVIRLLCRRALWILARAPLETRFAVFGLFFFQADGIGFYEPKALYIDE